MSEEWFGAYIGIPWKLNGRTRDGLDCWGLIWLVAHQRFALEVPAYDSYTGIEDPAVVAAAIAEHEHEWVRVEAPVEGDALLFGFGRAPRHVAIAVDAHRMLHIREGGSSRVDRWDAQPWKNMLRGIYRHPTRT